MFDCFEDDFSKWDSQSGSPFISVVRYHHGSSSYHCNNTMPTAEYVVKNTSEDEYYIHFYVYLDTLTCYANDSDVGKLAWIEASDNSVLAGLGIYRFSGANYFAVFYRHSTSLTSAAIRNVAFNKGDQLAQTGQWYEILVYYKKGVNGRVMVWVNQYLRVDLYVDNDDKVPTNFRLGHENYLGLSGIYTIYYDCFEANTYRVEFDCCMNRSGNPFIWFGFMNSTLDRIGPLNLPYSRVVDGLQEIAEHTYNADFSHWEWWFDYDGKIYFDEERGEDKSLTIKLEVADPIAGSLKEQITKQSAQRVRVVGRGESAEEDETTSDWHEDVDEQDSVIGSFYEKIISEKPVSQKTVADIFAQIYLAQLAMPREEITLKFENDPYTADDYDLGDYVTATDPATGIIGKYRVKTIEKWITADGGETVLVTLSNRKTDIADRLSDLVKRLEKMEFSSTYLDKLFGEGGKQTKLAQDKMEDVWGQTSSNKDFIELPEEETPPNEELLRECQQAGTIDWACEKDEFTITAGANGGLGSHGWVFLGSEGAPAGGNFNTSLIVKFSQDPRFVCDFEIDTDVGDAWQTGDFADILINQLNATNGFCTAPFGTAGFGFRIIYDGVNYVLRAYLWDGTGATDVCVDIASSLAVNTIYTIEARMEWKEKVVKFYCGRKDVDKGDHDEIRLRGILPINLSADDETNLASFWVRIDNTAASGANTVVIPIYRWKTQALKVAQGEEP